MSLSLRQLVDMLAYNAATQEWLPTAPTTDAAAVNTADGSNVETKLAAIPTTIAAAIDGLKDGVAPEGDTLKKLHDTMAGLQALLASDDLNLDTVQEIVAYIKANKSALELLGEGKVNITDVVNDLDCAVSGKILDARQGKHLKDTVGILQTAVTTLETQAENFATQKELNTLAAKAVPMISDTPPANPVDGQYWLRPVAAG